MKKIISSLLFISILMTINNAHAGLEEVKKTTITSIIAYTQFGNGDIQIKVSLGTPSCGHGFWLSPKDPGFKSALSVLLSAYHTNTLVSIHGENTKKWAGSNSYCQLIAIGLTK